MTCRHEFSIRKKDAVRRYRWFWFFGWRAFRWGNRWVRRYRVCERCGVSATAALHFNWRCKP